MAILQNLYKQSNSQLMKEMNNLLIEQYKARINNFVDAEYHFSLENLSEMINYCDDTLGGIDYSNLNYLTDSGKVIVNGDQIAIEIFFVKKENEVIFMFLITKNKETRNCLIKRIGTEYKRLNAGEIQGNVLTMPTSEIDKHWVNEDDFMFNFVDYIMFYASAAPTLVKTVEKTESVCVTKKTSHGTKKAKQNIRKVIYNFPSIKEHKRFIGRKKPDEEFGVRGHWRTYKSGKRVWVKAFHKCVGMGNYKPTQYKM